MLSQAGHRLVGADLLIDSDVPIGAGLSSSAALEVSTGYALWTAPASRWSAPSLRSPASAPRTSSSACAAASWTSSSPATAPRACFAASTAAAWRFRLAPIEPSVRLVICNSMVRHALPAGEYNRRRAECERGVALLAPLIPGIRALRDVDAGRAARARRALPDLSCAAAAMSSPRTTACCAPSPRWTPASSRSSGA